MKDQNTKSKNIQLNKRNIRSWMELVVKVNNGFELDGKETALLGLGLFAVNKQQTPDELKPLIEKAEKYFQENK
mgnify:CR=1 FL=1